MIKPLSSLLLLLSLSCLPCLVYAQDPDSILKCEWAATKNPCRIRFEKLADGSYTAYIVDVDHSRYVNGQPPLDSKNPDRSLRNQSIIGVVLTKNLLYDAEKKIWETDYIYQPIRGLIAKGRMSFNETGCLVLQGSKFGIKDSDILKPIK